MSRGECQHPRTLPKSIAIAVAAAGPSGSPRAAKCRTRWGRNARHCRARLRRSYSSGLSPDGGGDRSAREGEAVIRDAGDGTTPRAIKSQNSSVLLAPGKRHAQPTIATSLLIWWRSPKHPPISRYRGRAAICRGSGYRVGVLGDLHHINGGEVAVSAGHAAFPRHMLQTVLGFDEGVVPSPTSLSGRPNLCFAAGV